jgi:hypothetical protein
MQNPDQVHRLNVGATSSQIYQHDDQWYGHLLPLDHQYLSWGFRAPRHAAVYPLDTRVELEGMF